MSTIQTNAILDASGGTTATVNGYTPGPSNMMGRNKIINGKMEIAQRGTSFAAITGGSYSLDRWSVNTAATTAVLTASQQADVPASNEFQNSLRWAVTTADTSIAAVDLYEIGQPIEGYNVRDLIGKTFTLSFWVRSSKTGIHCVSFRNNGADRSYVLEYTINAANTWEYKSVTVIGGLITAGSWNWANGIGLLIRWPLAAGSNFQTTAGAWQTGAYVATANQVNCLDTIGNIFAITGVQLEVGSVATPFEHRPYGAELALCQRYYAKLTAGSGAYTAFGSGMFRSATNSQIFLKYPTTMRASPTISQSGCALDDTAATIAVTALGSIFAGLDSAVQQFTVASGGTQFRPCLLTANNNTAAYIDFSVEL
jgi:hypothetical protein